MNITQSHVAILMSTYNGNRYLHEQINSLLAQDYNSLTIYIRDDGSTDDTVAILNSFIPNDKIVIVQDDYSNLGPAKSFLSLLKTAEADIYMFCDQDDIWNVEKVSTIVSLLNTESNNRVPILVHSDLELINHDGSKMGESFYSRQRLDISKNYNLNLLAIQNCFVGCSLAFNQALKVKSNISNFDISKHNIFMHDWWIGLTAIIYGKVIFCKKNLVRYRQHDKNVVGARKNKKLIDLVSFFYLKNKFSSTLKYFDNVTAQQRSFLSLHSDDIPDRAFCILCIASGYKGFHLEKLYYIVKNKIYFRRFDLTLFYFFYYFIKAIGFKCK